MSLSKEAILARKPTEVIEVDLGDGDVVKVKGFSTKDYADLMRLSQKANVTDIEISAHTVMMSAVDDEGNRIFDTPDLPAILEMDIAVVGKIARAVLGEMDIAAAEVEAAKN